MMTSFLSRFMIGSVFVLFSLNHLYAQQTDKVFHICNYTTKGTVDVAAIYFWNNDWWGQGWDNLAQGDCTDDYDHQGNTFYFYAITQDEKTAWQGAKKFCVTNSRFKYKVENVTCDTGYFVGFRQVRSTKQHTDYNLYD